MVCKLCNRNFKVITSTHLEHHHGMSLRDYRKLFPEEPITLFPLLPNLLDKEDPRYLNWKESLRKRPPPWNKGETKETHPSVKRVSETMKKKQIDNFAEWRCRMVKLGEIKSEYPPFAKTKELAEFVGLVLGDGNIYKHERTEKLTIVFNTKYPRIISRARYLLTRIFEKKPAEETSKSGNAARMWIYEKYISRRLEIPAGAKKNYHLRIPEWAQKDRGLLRHCLVGLYNAEGSYSVHLPTCTYNMQFSNNNQSLLKDVHKSLKEFGFNPTARKNCVRLRKRAEAEEFAGLINFRYYRDCKS